MPSGYVELNKGGVPLSELFADLIQFLRRLFGR
jgi:hypothetical protein